MMNYLATIATASTLALSAGAASAVTVNLGVPGDVTSGIGTATGTFASGFLTGTITADAGPLGNPSITQDPTNGLGVSAGFLDPDDAIEDQGRSESLTIGFDQVAVLKSITAGFVDLFDEWDITVFGTGGDLDFSASAASTGPSPYTLDFGAGIEATGFVISAEGGTCLEQGIWFCRDFNENDVALKSFEVSPVPLPAAGWMLLAGLGGIAAMKRRKKADA